VRDVITALEDRRALYSTAVYEEPGHVVQSVLQMRQELTGGLKRISDGSPAKEAFRIMRGACRDFLENPVVANTDLDRMLTHSGYGHQEEFLIRLGQLRAIFGQKIAEIGYLYGIDIEGQLAAILPPDAGSDQD
jgi:hypothetical protein